MNLLLTPQQAAEHLPWSEQTIRRMINEGRITNVISNGCEGHGVRWIIDMTKEFGIENKGRRK